jgi:hypothetical protein
LTATEYPNRNKLLQVEDEQSCVFFRGEQKRLYDKFIDHWIRLRTNVRASAMGHTMISQSAQSDQILTLILEYTTMKAKERFLGWDSLMTEAERHETVVHDIRTIPTRVPAWSKRWPTYPPVATKVIEHYNHLATKRRGVYIKLRGIKLSTLSDQELADVLEKPISELTEDDRREVFSVAHTNKESGSGGDTEMKSKKEQKK